MEPQRLHEIIDGSHPTKNNQNTPRGERVIYLNSLLFSTISDIKKNTYLLGYKTATVVKTTFAKGATKESRNMAAIRTEKTVQANFNYSKLGGKRSACVRG